MSNSGSRRIHSLRFDDLAHDRSDIQDEIDAQAGDVGDRVVSFSEHSAASNGEDTEFLDSWHAIGICGEGPEEVVAPELLSGVSPAGAEVSPLPIDPILKAGSSKQGTHDSTSPTGKEVEKSASKLLLYLSYLLHLAVFGILGVFARYLLQQLFGPGRANITNDNTSLYIDLPANMVGSFLMGWFGIVFKANISQVSEFLAVGLTTGFLGSLTTFSGWNQKMLDLTNNGKWPVAAFGILIGIIAVDSSINMGVLSACALKCVLTKMSPCGSITLNMQSGRRQKVMLVFMLAVLGLLWGISGQRMKRSLVQNYSIAQLWLACLVGPAGVWVRWRLASMNGKGVGRKGFMKWMPFGTLLANIVAACLMAGLSTVKKKVATCFGCLYIFVYKVIGFHMLQVNKARAHIFINGIQLGFLGCLSTVSTFAAELYVMRQNNQHGRAVTYTALTIIPSFVIGKLIF